MNVTISDFLGIKDLLITPFFLIFLYIFIYIFSRRLIPDPKLRKYFIYGISLKILGALMLGIIYQFYYDGSGDTGLYFALGEELYKAIFKDPVQAFNLIFFPESAERVYHTSFLLSQYYQDSSSFLIARISGVFSIFTFNTYAGNAILFALFTFYGIWKLFKMLYYIFPQIQAQLAFCFLFYPSIIFWGSGVMKDGIALSALCMGFYSLYNLSENKKGKLKYILGFLLSLYLMSYIKIYITLCFIPTASLWFFATYNKSIRSSLLRWVLWPLAIILGLGIGIYGGAAVTANDNKYSIDKIAETAQTSSLYLGKLSVQQGGSYYSLGNYDATWQGILPIVPAAIWVTLYRPYIWEIKNPLMLLSALESTFLFFFTLSVIFKTGFLKSLKIILDSPFLIFCIVFTLVFSFALGISTYNFGSLVRYKIPVLPFFTSMLYIIRNHYRLKQII